MTTAQKRKMTDIHMHLIPGVDDGAEDMEMALEMLRQAGEQGITRIFATSHSSAFHDDRNEARTMFRSLEDAAAQVCPDMKLYLGCEVFCEPEIMDRVIKALQRGWYPTMNGTNRVLMEFPHWICPEEALACVQAMADAGYRPIIAHMERYRNLCDHMALVDRFRSLGACIQVNAYSLSHERDDAIRSWARILVQARKADFLGTDAHRTDHRPPQAELGLKWLYENMDWEYADALAWGNAERVLLAGNKTGIPRLWNKMKRWLAGAQRKARA